MADSSYGDLHSSIHVTTTTCYSPLYYIVDAFLLHKATSALYVAYYPSHHRSDVLWLSCVLCWMRIAHAQLRSHGEHIIHGIYPNTEQM